MELALSFASKNRVDPMVRGGKGLSLAMMSGMGLPVPPGFTIPSSVGRSFMSVGKMPKKLGWHVVRELAALEKVTGRTLGGVERPLLISVRSGAMASMPGMMDTVLNLGLNDKTVKTLEEETGSWTFASNCYTRLIVGYLTTVSGVPPNKLAGLSLFQLLSQWGKLFPQDPTDQLSGAVEAVFKSWSSPRAIEYRRASSIPNWWSTAVNVQAMVFGNRDERSAAGVAFSSNPATGDKGIYGEFLPMAQGEDVVSGTHTPRPLKEMQTWNQEAYKELVQISEGLEKHLKVPVDIEFTVESGKLYILQFRKAKQSLVATVRSIVRNHWDGGLTRAEVVKKAGPLILGLNSSRFDWSELPDLKGIPASPGCAVGVVVTRIEDAIRHASSGYQPILFRPSTLPEDLHGILVATAVVTQTGGATSHAAIVTREKNIPAVVGCSGVEISDKGVMINGRLLLAGSTYASVNGATGEIFFRRLTPVYGKMIKEVELVRKWASQSRVPHQPRLDWSVLSRTLNPCDELADFYLTESIILSLRNIGSPLLVDAVEVRNRVHNEMAARLAAYLVVAVAGELRHTNTRCANIKKIVESIEGKFGPLASSTNRLLCQMNVVKKIQVLSIQGVADYLAEAELVFAKGEWLGSFGGRAWATIAKTPKDFLLGNLNTTTFVDLVFDLQHNSGRVFDKHTCYRILSNMTSLNSALTWKKGTNESCKGVYHEFVKRRGFALSREVSALYAKVEKEIK